MNDDEVMRAALREPGWYTVFRTPRGDVRVPVEDFADLEHVEDDLFTVTVVHDFPADAAPRDLLGRFTSLGTFHRLYRPEPAAD